MQTNPELLNASTRLYRLMLTAYPVRFRSEFGYHMVQAFRDDMRDMLRERGFQGLAYLWLLTFFDLVKTAFAEHLWEVFHMPTEKLQRWSGPAAAVGGSLWGAVIALIQSRHEIPDWLTLIPGLVFVVIALALMGMGLLGLTHRQPATTHPGFLSTITLIGLFIYVCGLAAMGLGAWSQVIAGMAVLGFALLLLGLTVTGLGTLRNGTLGRLGFAPLITAAAGLCWLLSISWFGVAEIMSWVMWLIYTLSWIVMGLGLWVGAQPDGPNFARPA